MTRERPESGQKSPRSRSVCVETNAIKKRKEKILSRGRRGTTGANEHRDRVEPRRRVIRPEARRAAGRTTKRSVRATETRVARACVARPRARSHRARFVPTSTRRASRRNVESARVGKAIGPSMARSPRTFAAAKRPGEARRAERGGGRARERGHVVGRRMRTTREVMRVAMWTPRARERQRRILSSQHPCSGLPGAESQSRDFLGITILGNQRNWQADWSPYVATVRKPLRWYVHFTSRVWKTTRVGKGRAASIRRANSNPSNHHHNVRRKKHTYDPT